MKIVIVAYCEMLASLISGVLNSGHEIVGVFRNENVIYSPIKRSLYDTFLPSEDKTFVKTLGLYDIKASSVNSEKFRRKIKELDTDVIIVGSWSEKFSDKTIKTPKIACINTHPSLLPRYRGPNPYINVILNSEKSSGITFHLMNEIYDSGDILKQVKTDISSYETGYSLKLKCCEIARKEIGNLLNNLEENIKNAKSQDENAASYFKLPDIKDTILDFEKETSEEISRRIRAYTPWIKCYIPYKNEFFEFGGYKFSDKKYIAKPAEIVFKTKNSIGIMCSDNKVMEFTRLKLERNILRLFSNQYLKYFVEINTKVV